MSIVLSGDLLQLKPVRAAQVFEAPLGQKYNAYHEMVNLWKMFENIELTHNHRQAEDREYAFILNRIRMGDHTEDDMKTLASRISGESPPEALYVFGENKYCKKHNDAYVEKIEGEMHTFPAFYPKGQKFLKETVCSKTGRVRNTSFLDELRLKTGAKVIIIHNVDTPDHLSNGTCGYVAGFEWTGGKTPEISKILVQCDDPRAGAKERARHSKHPKYPDATPIGRETFEFKIGRDNHAWKAKLIQFPIDIGSALTCHKVQGMSLKPPKKLVADLDSIFEVYNEKTKKKDLAVPGMAYVMLGRVQNINQLILRWSYDPVPKEDPVDEVERLLKNEKALRKISVNEEAKEEALELKKRARNNPHNLNNNEWLYKKARLKIVSLNVQGSLQTRLADLKKDKSIIAGDIICLQEIGTSARRLELEGYTYIDAGAGRNKGVAIYIKDGMKKDVKETLPFENQFCQVLKLSCGAFDLINVYLANGQTASSIKR